jgi:glyoxylase-like metal-dependent hydrolase (beta-lactamase superfamily II)
VLVDDVRVIPFLVSELRLPPDEQATLGRAWWPSFAHAIVHPGGVFLFDNGAGFGDPEIDAMFTPRARPIEDCLAEHGIAMADVTGVANCHLHFDHCGQNVRLPGGVPIFVQRAEWAKVFEPDYTVPAWVDAPHLSYEVLDGETPVASGMRLVPTPGHTPGHQSLVLDAAEGTVVLAGQALQSRAEWEGDAAEPASGLPGAPDPTAYERSVAHLRALDPVRVHFAHDEAIWHR